CGAAPLAGFGRIPLTRALAGMAAMGALALISAVIVRIRVIGVTGVGLVGTGVGCGCKHAEGQRAVRKSGGGGDEPLTHVLSWVFRSWSYAGRGEKDDGPARWRFTVTPQHAGLLCRRVYRPRCPFLTDRSRGYCAPGSLLAATGTDLQVAPVWVAHVARIGPYLRARRECVVRAAHKALCFAIVAET